MLAWLGGKVGDELRAKGQNPLDAKALVDAVKEESHFILGAVLLVCVLYFVGMKMTAPKPPHPPAAANVATTRL